MAPNSHLIARIVSSTVERDQKDLASFKCPHMRLRFSLLVYVHKVLYPIIIITQPKIQQIP